MDRRTFSKTIAAGLSAASLPSVCAQKRRNIKIGHTGVTWGLPLADPILLEQAIRDIGSLGYNGLELFGANLETLEAVAALAPALEKYNLPLVSAYCGVGLTNPAQRQTSIERIQRWGDILKKYGGRVVVLGPNAVPREKYDFKVYKDSIVSTLNKCAKTATDMGLTAVLHQHTGTCIETRDETTAVLEAADTRYLKFGPDIGQLQKGGSDPVQVLKDFLPLVQHCHLKDYSGGEHWLGYCPLGQGKVPIPQILDMLEGRSLAGMVMVELDSSPKMPLTPLEAARVAKGYLIEQGCTFRS